MSAFFKTSLVSRLLGSAAFVTLAAGVTVSCGTKDSPGAVMLGMSTDMVVPDAVASVGLYVYSGTPGNGKPIYSVKRDAQKLGGINKVSFPATFAVVASEGQSRQIRVRLVAFGKDDLPRVLRESVTTIPTGRTSYLRMALTGINDGTAKSPTQMGTKGYDQLGTRFSGNVDEFEGLSVPDCPLGSLIDPTATVKTFDDNGLCVSALVAEADMPDYSDALAFGGGTADGKGSTCFPLAGCFGAAEKVTVNADCTLSGVNNLVSRTLAVDATKSPTYPVNGTDGASHFYIPLTESAFDPASGHTKLESAYCTRYQAMIQNEHVLGLYAAAASCGLKLLDVPLCEVFPQAEKHGSGADGGAFDTGTANDGGAAEAGWQCPSSNPAMGYPQATCLNQDGPEPNLMGLAIAAGRVYVAGTDPQSMNTNPLKPFVRLISFPPAGGMISTVAFNALTDNTDYPLSGYRLKATTNNSDPYVVLASQGDPIATVDGSAVHTPGQVVVHGPLNKLNPSSVRLSFADSKLSFFGAETGASGKGLFLVGHDGSQVAKTWDVPDTTIVPMSVITSSDVVPTLVPKSSSFYSCLTGALVNNTQFWMAGQAYGASANLYLKQAGSSAFAPYTQGPKVPQNANVISMAWDTDSSSIFVMYTTQTVLRSGYSGGIYRVAAPTNSDPPTSDATMVTNNLALAAFPNTNELVVANGHVYATDADGDILACDTATNGSCAPIMAGEKNPRAIGYSTDGGHKRLFWTTREDPLQPTAMGSVRSLVLP